jgi:hypothetical protein
MIGAEIRNQLLHPHVGNLAKQRVGCEFEGSDAVKYSWCKYRKRDKYKNKYEFVLFAAVKRK